MLQDIVAALDTEDRGQELELLYDVAVAMGQSLDLATILEMALDIVVNRLDMEAVSIYLFDEERKRLVARAQRGLTEQQQAIIERHRQETHDFAAWVVDTRRVLYTYEASTEKLGRMLWGEASARSMVGLPLLAKGKVVGEIGMTSKPGRQFSRKRAETLLVICRLIGIAIENALLIEEIRRSEQEARALYETGVEISASLELDEVMRAVAEGVRKVLAADIGLVGLLDSRRQEIVVQAVAGASDSWHKGARIPLRAGSRFAALGRGEPVVNDEYPARERDGAAPDSFLAAPLKRAGHLLGAVGVLSHECRHFAQREVQLLMRLASQVTMAVENAQLHRQVRHLAALEERERLARELHDGVAQNLSYLGMQASLTHQLVAGGRCAAVLASLQEISQVAQAAYDNVREVISDLRTTTPSELDLVAALRACLAEYRQHSGLDAQLTIEGEYLDELPTEVTTEVIRIVQEALTNVRKHARASQVWVRLEHAAHNIVISIEDDGVGFESAPDAALSNGHFGLQIMRERAKSVGGSLIIDSRPGSGTRVLISVPRFVGGGGDG